FDRYTAADIMFAPVAARFVTYSVPLPGFAATYVEALYTHPCIREWIEAAQDETWTIEKFEQALA
ncbi:MAG TPA: glutathione S-transferase family protein, partial [Sphingomonas sp.]|nr:glutathione S-transferase family protein [Sphingomonas sp.]